MPGPERPDAAPDAQPLSLDEVHAVARLARLDLPADRAELFRHQLGAVIGYVNRLRAMNLEGVEPLASPLEQPGSLAPDEPGPTLSPDTVAALAPERFEHFVKVPKVLGDAGGSA
ncbi:MAG: Asp-tRNA(Asn)/Glu-tRNA(Gln) amidotransferase subunit GatC [Phycisphaerae bacterium]|nr:Asp-tRNA(Asn)/Glu-tRNA(Gln) amidotransferase subunit GatC [Phycisphaerae bacterium]